MIVSLLMMAAASPTAHMPALQPWSYFVGHCWTGRAPDNAGDDRHCFETVFGGAHVRDRHVVTVNGREVYAGETLYSARGDKVVFVYWNSLGGTGSGEAHFSGGEWQFTGSIHATPTAAEQPLWASWRKVERGYEVRESASGTARLFRRAD